MTRSEAPEPWEVWHARFDFSEGKGYKYRLRAHRGEHLISVGVAGLPVSDDPLGILDGFERFPVGLGVLEVKWNPLLAHNLFVERASDGRQVEAEILRDAARRELGRFVNPDGYGCHVGIK